MNRSPEPSKRRRYRLCWVAATVVALGSTVLGAAWWLLRPDPQPTDAAPVAVQTDVAGPIVLRDATGATGIDFVHTHGGTGEQYIVEAMTGGVALADFDGDGLIDIYFLNGVPLPIDPDASGAPTNRLYRNQGDWTFRDATRQAGVGDTGYGLGVAVGDYNHDGFPDIYVNNFGPNIMYRNNGDGTFTDVTDQTGVADGSKVGAGAVFLDMDGDGDLDLYSANYVQFSYETNPRRMIGGFLRAPSPLDFPPTSDTLFRNEGDGTFLDVSEQSGISAHRGTGMGIVCSDYNNDGHTDIFICNDVWPNFLWENDGTGRFTEVGLEAGIAYDRFGRANGSMGVDAGDYDNDGNFDFFMTSYQSEPPVLYRNLGGGLYEDVTLVAGAAAGSTPHVNWGCGFVDLDNDGHRDLFVANGHIEPMIETIDKLASYRARNVVLHNQGNGSFVDVSALAGDGLAVKAASRGIGIDDLDNDGRVDVVVLNSDGIPTVLRNASANQNRWLQVRLRGIRSNRDGVGARVTVTSGDLSLVDQVHAGRGYQSHYGSRLHFGLGQRTRVDRLEVRWIGGGVDEHLDLDVDQLVTLIEGQGVE